MVESVPAVDGSNIFGMIEEVRANCALRSDRHLMLLSDLSVAKKNTFKHSIKHFKKYMQVSHVKTQQMRLWCAHLFLLKNGFS